MSEAIKIAIKIIVVE